MARTEWDRSYYEGWAEPEEIDLIRGVSVDDFPAELREEVEATFADECRTYDAKRR